MGMDLGRGLSTKELSYVCRKVHHKSGTEQFSEKSRPLGSLTS
jgi:hypothetical protein